MKSLLFLALLLPVTFFGQSPVNSKPVVKGFTLEGKLDGYPDGTTVKLYRNGDNTELGNAKVLKEKFSIKGNVTEPVLCFLVIGTQDPAEVYVENSIITFKSSKAKPTEFKIEGSAAHRDFSLFISSFLPLANHLHKLANTINSTMPGSERDSLMELYNNAQTGIQTGIDKFIADRPTSMIAPFVLNATYQFNEDPIILEKRFNSLNIKVKNSESGKQLEEFIAETKIGAIGTQSLDFTQPDTLGNPVSLSSFRGKYVLVDFWASWCGPCRQENPTVVESYHKFSKKNFTVLGVSLDRPGQKEKWLEAIKADQLAWTQVSDLKFWNNAAAQLYKVKGIPQNFLVDPDGKIVAKNLRGPALEAKLCEILGCN